MTHPRAPYSEGFSLPPTLSGVPLSTSNPLPLQPHKAGTGTDQGAVSQGENVPPLSKWLPVEFFIFPVFLVPLRLRWLEGPEKIMYKGWTCLNEKLEGQRDKDTWE